MDDIPDLVDHMDSSSMLVEDVEDEESDDELLGERDNQGGSRGRVRSDPTPTAQEEGSARHGIDDSDGDEVDTPLELLRARWLYLAHTHKPICAIVLSGSGTANLDELDEDELRTLIVRAELLLGHAKGTVNRNRVREQVITQWATWMGMNDSRKKECVNDLSNDTVVMSWLDEKLSVLESYLPKPVRVAMRAGYHLFKDRIPGYQLPEETEVTKATTVTPPDRKRRRLDEPSAEDLLAEEPSSE